MNLQGAPLSSVRGYQKQSSIMKVKKPSMLRMLHKNQRGVTLMGIIIAVAISGIIAGAATTAIFQVFTGNARTSSHMTAVKQVQNAGYWISHDVQMARGVVPDTGDTGFPLDLVIPVDTEPVNDYSVRYFFDGDKLKRQENDYPETLIAQYIDSDPTKTKCEFIDTDGDTIKDKLVFTVTATVGGWKPASETRVYEVIPRPSRQ